MQQVRLPCSSHLLEFAESHVHWVIVAIQPSYHCCSLLFLPSMFPSPASGYFPVNWLFALSWPKYWSFRFTISPSTEYSEFLFFKIDWFDPLAVQETSKSLLQYHSLKTSILCGLVFFMVQLSHPYLTTGKTIALIIWTFDCKVMSLLFNMLSKFVIAFSSKEQTYFNFMVIVTIHSDFGA